MNCLLCAKAPEACQCLDKLASGSTPATVIEGSIASVPERCSAIWVREDPRSGPPFLTVVLEPMAKATVDDVRLAVGALVRWKNAVNARVHRPFTEEAALAALLTLHDQLVEKLGPASRGIHVALANEINDRLEELLREHAHDVAIHDEARARVDRDGEGDHLPHLDEAIRQVVVDRFAAGHREAARYHSCLGGAMAESYLRALGYSPDATRQICERAVEDINLGRSPFAPEYPADRRRARELVRKARRKRPPAAPDRG